MYDLEMHSLLKAASGQTTLTYEQSEMPEIAATIDAVLQLEERVKKLLKKDRVKMPMHGSTRKVWEINSAIIRDRQVFVDSRTLYLQMPCRAITPVRPRAMGGVSNMDSFTAEEVSFIARFV